MTSDNLLLQVVMRCRRRAAILLFVEHAVYAFALSAAIAVTLPYLPGTTPVNSSTVVLLLTGVAVLGSAAAAAWRCPSAAAVAEVIDRRLQLDDSVAAALQVRGTGSPLAPLVARHALQCIAHVRPNQVFPLSVTRPAVLTASAAVILLVAAGSRAPHPATRQAASAGAGRGGVGVSSAARDRAATERPRADQAGAASATDDVTAAGSQPGESSRDGERSSQGAPSGDAEARRERGVAAQRSAEPNPDGNSDDVSPVATASPNHDLGTGGSAGNTGGMRPPSGESRGSSGHIADALGGGGAAAVSAARQQGGAGGVQGGRPLGSQSDRLASASSAARGSRGQSAAGINSASASWRDEVPPDLRSYVRNYLRAVRADQDGR